MGSEKREMTFIQKTIIRTNIFIRWKKLYFLSFANLFEEHKEPINKPLVKKHKIQQ